MRTEPELPFGGPMLAKELMTRSVECISPDTPLPVVARQMRSLDVGFLPICENNRLVGTLTDRDIVLRVIAEEKAPKDCRARDIMTSEVYWCYEDQTAEDVAHYMAHKAIRRLLILNREKRLVGVISIGDLAKGGEHRKTGEAMHDIAVTPAQAA